jgi:hypothetical protein
MFTILIHWLNHGTKGNDERTKVSTISEVRDKKLKELGI